MNENINQIDKQDPKYLGKEKLVKLLLRFSVPCITALLISALYNIVDQIFIGNSKLGYIGNAATGVSFPVICIVNAFAFCLGDGAASYLSICAGKNDTSDIHKSVGTGIIVTTIIGVLLAVVSIVFAEPLMWLFGASDQSIELAVDYFIIIAAFFPFYLLTTIINSTIRADGAPGYAMIAVAVGAVINIILDPIFIFLFDLGIEGAAWATIIGQVGSFILCAVYLLKPKNFKLNIDSFKIDFNVLKELIKLGGATFFTQISIVVVSLVSNILLSRYGELSIYGPDIPMSVFSIQIKAYTIVNSIVTGIVLGAQPIFGYNYGAKEFTRVKKLYKMILTSTIIIALAATILFQLFPDQIMDLFGSENNPLIYDFAEKTFRIYLSLLTVTCLIKMTAVFFQSIGKAVQATLASLIRDIACFSILAIALSIILENNKAGTGINGIIYAAPIADAIALILILILTIYFFKDLKKTELESR